MNSTALIPYIDITFEINLFAIPVGLVVSILSIFVYAKIKKISNKKKIKTRWKHFSSQLCINPIHANPDNLQNMINQLIGLDHLVLEIFSSKQYASYTDKINAFRIAMSDTNDYLRLEKRVKTYLDELIITHK